MGREGRKAMKKRWGLKIFFIGWQKTFSYLITNKTYLWPKFNKKEAAPTSISQNNYEKHPY